MAAAMPWNEVEQEDFSHLANPGIAIQQLLKMKARGAISMQQFLDLTMEAQGQDEERPIMLDSAPAQTAAAPAAATRPQAAAAPRVPHQPPAPPPHVQPQQKQQRPRPAQGGLAACFLRAGSSGSSSSSTSVRPAAAPTGGSATGKRPAAAAPEVDSDYDDSNSDDSDDDSDEADEEVVEDQEAPQPAAETPAAKTPAAKTPAAAEPEGTTAATPAAATSAAAEGATVAKRRRVEVGSTLSPEQQAFVNSRVSEWPGHQLKTDGGQLWCGLCKCNIGSSKQDTEKHCTKVKKHLAAKARADAGMDNQNMSMIRTAITDHEGVVMEQHGKAVSGLGSVTKETQDLRAETLEQIITAGIPVCKVDKLRPWLERRMGFSLTQRQHLMTTYLEPLRMKEVETLRTEFSGDDLFVGQYHDGTTHNGEAFATVWRAVKPGFIFVLRCVRVAWFRGSLTNAGISASLLDTAGVHMRKPLTMFLANMHDCVSANLKSYNETLSVAMPFSDDNGCLPHTGGHVGEHLETPVLDEFLIIYNAIVGTSNYAKVEYATICGAGCRSKSATRWWSSNDVAELSIGPNLANGNLLKWGRTLIEKKLCEKTAPKLVAILTNSTKFVLLQLETAVAVHVGKPLKAGDTTLEGDQFEFITGYDNVVSMATSLRNPITPQLHSDLEKLAASHRQRGGAPAAPAPAPVPTPTPTPAAEKSIKELVLEIPTAQINKVNCSINACFFNWYGETLPQPRYGGKFTSWLSKEAGSEQPRIKFEKGLDKEGMAQEGFEATAPFNLSDLLKPECDFRLEPFDDGTPAPGSQVLVAPVTAPVATALLLGSTNFGDVNVLLARTNAVVAPAVKYFGDSMETKRGAQLYRMKVVRIFNPLHVLSLGSPLIDLDVRELSAFRFSTHPKLALQLVQMESELPKYLELVAKIKPQSERLDAKGKDTFSLLDWWRGNEAEVPAWSYVLRAVLTNSPNSIPPERVFSILNDSFDDDQDSSFADYIEYSLQRQYNMRGRSE